MYYVLANQKYVYDYSSFIVIHMSSRDQVRSLVRAHVSGML
jgi:hypothetical protein